MWRSFNRRLMSQNPSPSGIPLSDLFMILLPSSASFFVLQAHHCRLPLGVRDALIAREPMPPRPERKPTSRDIQSLLSLAYKYSTIEPDSKFRLLQYLAKVHISEDESAFLVDHLHVSHAPFSMTSLRTGVSPWVFEVYSAPIEECICYEGVQG